jgi:hypothetical protein
MRYGMTRPHNDGSSRRETPRSNTEKHKDFSNTPPLRNQVPSLSGISFANTKSNAENHYHVDICSCNTAAVVSVT